MGLLDRAIDLVNRGYVAVDGLDTPVDRRFKRADRLIGEGERATARIAGIDRHLEGGTTVQAIALEFPNAAGIVRAGVRETTARGRERLRLGLQVPVRCDETRAVVDWPLLWATWDLKPGMVAARLLRSAPDDGVRERALDASAQTLLDGGVPARAAIVSVEHVVIHGMPTENFDLRLRLTAPGAGPEEILVDRDEIPFYAQWLAAPGAEVPIAVSPDDPSLGAVDWAAAAVEHVGRCGGVNDPPPPGGAAAALDAVRRLAAAQVVATPAPPVQQQVDGVDAGDPIEGVGFEEWIEIDVGLIRDRVPPDGHDAYAQDRGVAAGRWSSIDAAWHARVRSDWRLGARYGETYAAARKRRR